MKCACACAGEEGSERRCFWGRLGASAKLLWYEICVLHRHPVFLANIWAYVPVQAVLGALTFWGPKARPRHVYLACYPFRHCGHALAYGSRQQAHPVCVLASRRWSELSAVLVCMRLTQQGIMRRRLRWPCCGSLGTRWTW